MSDAIQGHGALLAVELDPVANAGVFTTVGELVGDISMGYNRPETEVTPHNEDIDSWIMGVLRREPIDMSVNYIYGDSVHDQLRTHIFDRRLFGVRFLGPSAGAGTAVDEVICSGYLSNFMETNPVREGARTAEITFRASGPMIVDGATVS